MDEKQRNIIFEQARHTKQKRRDNGQQNEHHVYLEHDRFKQQERRDHIHENKWFYYLKQQREAQRLRRENMIFFSIHRIHTSPADYYHYIK